jgi:hypothetical protein
MTAEELSTFKGKTASSLGLTYTAYTGYNVDFDYYYNGELKNSKYLIKSNNDSVFGCDNNGSASAFWANGSWQSNLDNLRITIKSTLSDVDGGSDLLEFLNRVATKVIASTDNTEVYGTWTMNETIDVSGFGGLKGDDSGLNINQKLYKGYKVNIQAGSVTSEYLLVHTTADLFGYYNGSGGAGFYMNGSWNKEEYRTLTILPTENTLGDLSVLAEWLKNNATKN